MPPEITSDSDLKSPVQLCFEYHAAVKIFSALFLFCWCYNGIFLLFSNSSLALGVWKPRESVAESAPCSFDLLVQQVLLCHFHLLCKGRSIFHALPSYISRFKTQRDQWVTRKLQLKSVSAWKTIPLAIQNTWVGIQMKAWHLHWTTETWIRPWNLHE